MWTAAKGELETTFLSLFCLGFFFSRLLRSQAQQQWGDPERWPELTKHMQFGRPAEPDEVADLTVFLASDRASYISGVAMTLDGGQAARH